MKTRLRAGDIGWVERAATQRHIPAKQQAPLFADYFATRSVAARNRIVEANLPIVLYCLRKYTSASRAQWPDLFQVGTQAMMHALSLYDPAKSKWITYATTAVRHAIVNYALENEGDVCVGRDARWKRGVKQPEYVRPQDWDRLFAPVPHATRSDMAEVWLEQLHPHWAAVVRARVLEELSAIEIDARFEFPPGRGRNFQQRAFERLREIVKQEQPERNIQ